MSQRMDHQLARFLMVGSVGFFVDVAVLALLLYGLGFAGEPFGLVGSRVLSSLAAVAVTFPLNARFTFRASVQSARLSRYVTIQGSGALLNIGVYSALVLGPLPRPLIALAAGSAVATVSNFLLARRYVYRWR